MAAEPDVPASRQNDLVIYDAKTAVSFVASGEVNAIRGPCGHVLAKSLAKWGEGKKDGFFGITYGAYVAGQCVFASDSDASSPQEVAKYVRLNCEAGVKRITGQTARCIPILHAVPSGVTLSSKRAVGRKTGEALLRNIKSVGDRFGAMALSADGAWNIAKSSTRAQAEADALAGCKSVAGRGYEALGAGLLSEMRGSCLIVYRFGRDFPNANQIEVIRGK